MASMIGGDFVEAYVLKNAYKEKLRRMEEAEARSSRSSAPGEEKKTKAAGSGRGGGLFGGGLMKKKVHPKATGSAVEASPASS